MSPQRRHAFTLLEVLMALAAGAVILTAIYGVFSKAVQLRDRATERTREVRVRARATAMIRQDLRNARISGGELAVTLQGSREAAGSSFPGSLRFTTTTARDSTATPTSDLQEVSYYIVTDPAATDARAGLLVRAVERNLLAEVRETPPEEPVLAGVAAMEVEFYDGTSWQDSWEVTTEAPRLPQGVRVRIHPAAPVGERPSPVEVLVPWTTQMAVETEAS